MGHIRHYGLGSHFQTHSITNINSTANEERTLCSVTHPELVGPELIDVGALSGDGLVPEAELQQELVSARHQHLTPLLPVRCEVLPMDRHQSISFTSTDGCTPLLAHY